MAGKQKFSGYGDIEFAKWSWSAEDDANYEKWLREKSPDLPEAITWLVDADYKLSIAYDGQSEAYKASATGNGKKNVNDGVCITSWAESVDDAVLITLFKIVVLWEGKRAPTASANKGGRR